MKTTSFTLITRDGLRLPGQAWLPSKPKGFITIVHGINEHSGRYKRFAEAAVALNIGVVSVDLRSHGRSPGERAYVDHFSEFLLDVDALVAKTQEFAGKLSIVLMGHSMGGTIAMRWIAERQPSASVITGLVMSSAALKIGPDIPKALQLLAPVISQLAPRVRLSAIDSKSISRDPEEVKAFLNDPLVCHMKAPARTGSEILSAIAANKAAAGVLIQPIYILHGSKDTLTDPDGSRDLHAAWGGSDKTLRIWQNNVHETLNDLDRVGVTEELLEWVESKLVVKAAVKAVKRVAQKTAASVEVKVSNAVKKAAGAAKTAKTVKEVVAQ
jgi:acylglycerol lipase